MVKLIGKEGSTVQRERGADQDKGEVTSQRVVERSVDKEYLTVVLEKPLKNENMTSVTSTSIEQPL